MYAIIRSGGKQYKVKEGDRLKVETLEADISSSVDFSDVLAVHNGDNLLIGKPLVETAKVTGTVTHHGRGPKIIVFKKRKRKGFKCKNGHRQNYTEVKIESITAG